MNKKIMILFALLFIGYSSLTAQEYSTDISIREQLVNNKQPGAVYAPIVAKAPASEKGFTGSSLARMIREGKTGIPVTNSSAPRPANTETVVKAPGTTLPSETSAAEAKAAEEKRIKEQPPISIPSHQQEEKKEVRPKG